jgi:hypothetical protein
MTFMVFRLDLNQIQRRPVIRYVGYVQQRSYSGASEIGGLESARKALLKTAERTVPMEVHVTVGRIMVFNPLFIPFLVLLMT